MRVLGMVLGPVASLLVGVGNAVTPGRGFRNGLFASEIELLEIVDMARERGVVADDESRMIQSVFELGDTTAREVMTPRTEMVWIESDKTVGQAARLTVKSGYSRIPVVDGDNSDDVVGVIYLRDIVARLSVSDATVGELAEPFDVSIQAVSKHVKVLADAGLVTQRKDAQRRPCHLEAEVLDLMTGWIERYRRRAQERYERLDAVLAAMPDDEPPDHTPTDTHHRHGGAASGHAPAREHAAESRPRR